MAHSNKDAALAFVAEVARFLAVDADAVQRMIRMAKLPAIKIPMNTRNVYRIPLRDFHGWLLKRTINPTPEWENYDKFLEDFSQVRIRNAHKQE